MWQRIQTLFMVLAIIALVLHLMLPTGTAEGNALFALDTVLAGIPPAFAIILTFFAITQFRNRKRQQQVNWISIAAIAVTYAIWLMSAERQLPDYAPDWGMYVPGFAALFLLIANYRIRKDQQLVDSMDRLR
ncbi:MAG: hypothetical protein ABR95_04105 [Sphingobacteriales bacterium BACL12 MAG-120813-bin55]|jgi:uncharacterized membrane-anchored protein|nr:MAG: hypothetical protein ABR94_13330 [Sphingobacteriales bacterium BACL12 MAG-120802-bin5]KRP10282.1 MAG: hypothetical protein ABR95_04105 [Sphingobacteriales bacterium BACL12 MAG-120813-bin55]